MPVLPAEVPGIPQHPPPLRWNRRHQTSRRASRPKALRRRTSRGEQSSPTPGNPTSRLTPPPRRPGRRGLARPSTPTA